ncbi:hypothetical protein A1O3_03313 [Capronia epimyces CBS 606.96]|uniref:RNA helicase n=1 Tax=Capronia epimyces CBS 606.96 TaxID=1182542 RepID=W9Y0R2_9EURO|nr:uncharacterized protein A1O3_03313 [Capronia epimyces CBS 606.96]EXJ86362.1 hypothetical protein A1O3_03313 [Capronia epimyces CBS 606.96]
MDLQFIPALFTPSELLPIARHRDSLLYTIETHQVTVLVGQTGSGKTTQLPQYLEQAGWCDSWKRIAVTQPRRVAVTTLATRVAEEMKCQIGEKVGYSIRFEDVTSPETRIKFLTDGMLLREALVDPLLSRYSVIMVDEAHERSLSSDILLGLLKKIMKRRPELRIVVSSATLEAERFADFFRGDDSSSEQCRIVSIEGRTYPVDILYLDQPADDYVDKAIQTAFTIHQQEPAGDILVFLTGREEIEIAMQKLSDLASTLHPQAQALQPLPLYAGLSSEDQSYVFYEAAENTRKVILSTNIAEASVTISGIVYVVDCGFVKLRSFNPTTNIDRLAPFPVSKASATQRAGRAGRTRPGKCFRLYTERAYQSLPATTTPEIQRSNLAPVVLQLKALGIDNIVRFDFLSPPPSQLLVRAFDLLYSLGAIDEYAKLTSPLGTRMAELSIPPMMAKCLLVSSDPRFNCQSEMLTIAAMTSLEGNVWFHHSGEKKAMDLSRKKFAAEEGDHLTLLNVYQAFVAQGKKEARWCHDHHLNFKSMQRAVSVRNQLRRYLERLGVKVQESLSTSKPPHLSTVQPTNTDKSTHILQCLVTGYFSQAAKMQPDGSFRSVSGNVAMYAHPTSLLFNRKAEFVVFHEVLETGAKVYMKDLSKVEKGWLVDFSGGYYEKKP